MPSVLLSPVGNGQQFFDNNGVLLSGGLIYTYQAGSSTALATYTTNAGTIANSNPIVLDAAGRTPQEIWMQVGYSYKLVIQDSAGVTLQTLDNLYPILQNANASGAVIPSGLIAIWSGSVGSIPSGWVICNGTNGTPDLRNSFVLGAGDVYSVGQTGGSKDAIVVSHTHTVTGQDGSGSGAVTSFPTAAGATGTAVTTSSAGASGTNANMPPYYALAFIMKS